MSIQKDLRADRTEVYHFKLGDRSLIFSKTEVQRLARWSMELFTEWLLDGVTFEVDHGFDPSWDHSGVLIHRKLTEEEKKENMSGTLGEWMRSQYSGNSTASFMSGCGMFHDNYENVIEDYIKDSIGEVLRSQVSEEEWWDITDNDDFCDFEADLRFRIVDAIQSIPTRDAYQWCEKAVLRRRVRRDVENQKRQTYLTECSRRADVFQKRFLPWLPMNIDKPLWRKSGIEEQLKEALKNADSETLEALREVGLMGIFSNSVASEIEKILAEASRNSLN
jgi:hypothetical protein